MITFLFSLIAALPPGLNADMLPGVDSRKPEEIELAGLASLYPGRVLTSPPRAKDTRNAGRQPKVVELPRNVTYARIYDLDVSVPKITELLAKPTLILDLRYITDNADAAEAFARALMRSGLAASPVHAVGDMKEPNDPPPADDPKHVPPLVLVLVNQETSGPVEAWLAAFQDKESVLAVGTATAGQPGAYQGVEGMPNYYFISGELRPTSGSVAGTGVKPRFAVDVKPPQNFLAYQSFENGVDLAHLLRREPLTLPPTQQAASGNVTSGNATVKTAVPAAPEEEIIDTVLQRAVDVVAALQVLGRVPSSTSSDTAKTPVAPQPAVSTPNSTSTQP